MALYDGKISVRSSLDQVWWAAEMTLTPAQQVVSATKPAAFAAMDENYGYVYVFRERANGEVGIRLLIDETVRVREVFSTYHGSDALNQLAMSSSADGELVRELMQDGDQRLREIKTIAERATMAPQLGTLSPEPGFADPAQSPDVLLHQALQRQYRSEQEAVPHPMTVSRMDQRTIRPQFGVPALVFVVVAVLLIVAGMVFYAIGRTTPNRFEDNTFAVQYPADGWTVLDVNTIDTCVDAIPPCALVLGKPPFNSVTVQFRSITTDIPRDRLDIEANEWNNMQAADPTLEFVRQEVLQIGGKDAVRMTYRRQRGADNLVLLRTIVIVTSTRFLETLVTATSTARYADYRGEIDDIMATITLKQ